MSQDSFAFVIHPIDFQRDVSRKYPALGHLPAWLIEFLSIFYPPVFISEISGIRSKVNGRQLRGWFIACPLSPRMMMALPAEVVYRKIIQSGRLAERLGARILGLGAYTSVVGDGGRTVARALQIPVTTGNSYTVATSMHAVRYAARRLKIELPEATAAVVGASGAIGGICARLLAPDVKRLILVGRSEQALQRVAEQSLQAGAAPVCTTTDITRIRQAQIVISVTSAVEPVIRSEHLRPGAIVCDVARPRDVARQVSEERPDVLVIEGGMVQVPGDVDFGFDFGFPFGMAYACMAETIALALEGRYESYTLGKQLELAQITEIDEIATRHGFQLGGLRNLEQVLSESELTAVASRHREMNVATVGAQRSLPVTF